LQVCSSGMTSWPFGYVSQRVISNNCTFASTLGAVYSIRFIRVHPLPFLAPFGVMNTIWSPQLAPRSFAPSLIVPTCFPLCPLRLVWFLRVFPFPPPETSDKRPFPPQKLLTRPPFPPTAIHTKNFLDEILFFSLHSSFFLHKSLIVKHLVVYPLGAPFFSSSRPFFQHFFTQNWWIPSLSSVFAHHLSCLCHYTRLFLLADFDN